MRVLSVAFTLVLAVSSLAAITTPTTSNPIQDIIKAVSNPNQQVQQAGVNRVAAGPNVAGGAPQFQGSQDFQRFADILSQSTMDLYQAATNLQSQDPSKTSGAVMSIKISVCDTAEKLRIALKEGRLTESEMSALVPVVFGYLSTLNTILVSLIQATIAVLGGPPSNILEVLNQLLDCVSELVEVLKSCIVDPDGHVLGPIFKLVECIVKEVANFFGLTDVW